MPHDTPILIRGGIVIDGTGHDPRIRSSVLVEGERITRISAERGMALAKGWRVIDAEGHTVLPGLIDAHVHFFGSRSPDPMMWAIEPQSLNCARAVFDAWKLLDYGFTTVRDVGSRNGVALKRATDEETIIGPRIGPAHLGLSQTCGHGDVHNLPSHWLAGQSVMAHIVDGVDNVRAAVRSSIRDGADLVKVWATGGTMSERDSLEDQHYSMEELRAIVEEAHRFRRKVASHAEGLLGARASISAGVDSIEHGFVLDEEACGKMKAQGVFLVPTLVLLERVVNTPGVPEFAKQKGRPMFKAHLESFKLAAAMGVRIGAGSDAFSDPVTPFGPYNIRELQLMVNAGLTPLEAIQTATANNAELLGLDDQLGALEEGKLADILVVEEDLTQDIAPLMDRANILAVLKGGRQMPRLGDVWPG